jgi:hypothetical protein
VGSRFGENQPTQHHRLGKWEVCVCGGGGDLSPPCPCVQGMSNVRGSLLVIEKKNLGRGPYAIHDEHTLRYTCRHAA